jgi:hypothetical protein
MNSWASSCAQSIKRLHTLAKLIIYLQIQRFSGSVEQSSLLVPLITLRKRARYS